MVVGLGFAVPSNMAKRVAEQLIKNGKVTRAWLGVGVQDLTPDLAKAMKVDPYAGALINDTVAGGPAFNAKVVPGDIGTCGGLLTDEHARVVGQDQQPIEGLYAAGNITATVMGRHYLGPGASIANGMVFGYLAARHATGQDDGGATDGR